MPLQEPTTTSSSSSGGTGWLVVAPDVTTTFFLDTGLAYATSYSYCIAAVSITGATASARSWRPRPASRLTSSRRRSCRSLSCTGRCLMVPSRASATRIQQRVPEFVAKINWGDGSFSLATVTGGNGSFLVDAAHVYARNGHYKVKVSVVMTGPVSAAASAWVRSSSRIRPGTCSGLGSSIESAGSRPERPRRPSRATSKAPPPESVPADFESVACYWNLFEGALNMTKAIRVAVTGAGGQIGYALLFRIASGGSGPISRSP